MIGIIIPPGDIKKLVEKTAEHVATNGFQFEKMLIERQQRKPEFAFLLNQNPYRAYYDHKVAEISKKLVQQAQGLIEEEKPEIKVQVQEEQKSDKPQQIIIQTNIIQPTFLQKIFQEIKEPDSQKYTAELPEKINEGELAIIQHTAQYVAKNGKNFLIALSEREKNNPQFQFLKTSSNNYKYFLNLVDGYTNVLNLEAEDLAIFKKYIQNKEAILKKCKTVYEYHRLKQDQTKGKKQQNKQVKENTVDWNDFQLVETILFDVDPSKNIKNGELISKLQQNAALIPRSMEEKVISEPKKREILQQCHICRQNILSSELNKHLKSCLGEKKKINASLNYEGQEVDIRKNLQSFSSKRPDIFGTQENHISRRQEEVVKEQQRVMFDGQAPNITRTTGAIAMLQNQQKKLKQQQQQQGSK